MTSQSTSGPAVFEESSTNSFRDRVRKRLKFAFLLCSLLAVSTLLFWLRIQVQNQITVVNESDEQLTINVFLQSNPAPFIHEYVIKPHEQLQTQFPVVRESIVDISARANEYELPLICIRRDDGLLWGKRMKLSLSRQLSTPGITVEGTFLRQFVLKNRSYVPLPASWF